MPQRIVLCEKKSHRPPRFAVLAALVMGAAVFAGCTRESDAAAEVLVPDAIAQTADGSIATAASGDGAAPSLIAMEEKTDAFELTWSWPAVAEAIPVLAAHLAAEREKAMRELAADAESWKEEAEKNGFPFNPYSLEKTWSVVADTPDYLSLSAQAYTYTGGAHGMSYFDALVWDKQAGKVLEPAAMFVSLDAIDSAVRPDFCELLDRQRAEKRGKPLSANRAGMFKDCIPVKSSTVILGSTNRQKFDRLGFLIGPYEAGPYAEGSYEVTLPISDAIMAAVKPAYRAAFSVPR